MLAPFQARIPAHSGQNELNQYVMEHVRQSPINLVDLRPAKIKDLGSFDNIGMKLQLEASYEDLRQFLVWVENDRRMLRIDSLKVDPIKDGTRAERPARPAEPGRKREKRKCRAPDQGWQDRGQEMNATKLLKLAPTLIMVAAMAYAAYSIDRAATGRPASRNDQVCSGRTSSKPSTNAEEERLAAQASASSAFGSGPQSVRRRSSSQNRPAKPAWVRGQEVAS